MQIKSVSYFTNLVFFLLSSKGGKKQQLFRMDGYYFYDNNSDSFHVVPNSEQDFIETVQHLKEMGLEVSTVRKFDTCAPDSLVFLTGSPFLGIYNIYASQSLFAEIL